MRSPRFAAVSRPAPELTRSPEPQAEAQDDAAAAILSATPFDIAQYQCDVILQLRDLARRGEMKFLAYLLEMAFEEAFLQANRLAPDGKAPNS